MTVRHPVGAWALAVLLTLGAEAARAQSPADAVVEQLREQGYVELQVSRTLLGRVRVIALSADGGQREIILSPATGEILRDYVKAADGTPALRILDRTGDDAPAGTTGGEAASDDEGPGPRGNGNAHGSDNGNSSAGGNGSGASNGHGAGNGNRNAGDNGRGSQD